MADTWAYLTDSTCMRAIPGPGDYYLRRGEPRTLPAGTAVRMPD